MLDHVSEVGISFDLGVGDRMPLLEVSIRNLLAVTEPTASRVQISELTVKFKLGLLGGFCASLDVRVSMSRVIRLELRKFEDTVLLTVEVPERFLDDFPPGQGKLLDQVSEQRFIIDQAVLAHVINTEDHLKF